MIFIISLVMYCVNTNSIKTRAEAENKFLFTILDLILT